MNTNDPPPPSESNRAEASFAFRFACFFTGVVAIYVLSFGPVSRLTTTVIDGTGGGFRITRQPTFPSWCRWTTIVYRPLLAVQGGQAGPLPRRAIAWYVNLWG